MAGNSDKNKQKAKDNWDRYVYARDNGHLEYVKKASACENYFYGAHWDANHKAKLEGQGKPVLTINKVFSTLLTQMGEQLKNQAGVGFLPTASGTPETADALNKVWLHIMKDQGYKYLESEVYDDGIITSRGFLDVRVGFNDSMQGEVDFSLLNAKNVVIDPDAHSYDPDDWNECFITSWMTPNDIAARYSKAIADELKLKRRQDFQYGYDSVDTIKNTFAGAKSRYPGVTSGATDADNRRFIRVIERQSVTVRRRDHFVDMITGDTRVVPHTWTKQRIAEVASQYNLGIIKKDIKEIDWIITADDYVLFESKSPLKHFTPVPFFPVFHKGKTIGLVENLISPQDFLNKTTSQELHVINTTANSGWQMEEDQLVNMDPDELEQRGAETGLVIVRKKGSEPLDKINPNQVPTGLDRMSYKGDEYIKELSGISDSQRGMDRADVAAKAIQAKQAAGSVNHAKVSFNLSRTRHLIAKRVLDIVQEYYTEERMFKITGGGIQPTTEDLTVNQASPEGEILNDLTIGEYDVVITDVPARDTFEESQFQEALSLREIGVAIPDHVLIEHSHLNNKEEIAEALKVANGGGEPTELDQQAKQLELELAQLVNAEKQVEIKAKAADAQLSQARAVKTVAEAQNMGSEESQALEAQKLQAELQIKREEIAAQIELKREELAATMELKREELRQNMLIKRAEAAQKAEDVRTKQNEKNAAPKEEKS